MELNQVETNLKGITELVNALVEEVERMKSETVGEQKEKTYQLNLYTIKPTCYEREVGVNHYDEYFLISVTGGIRQEFWSNNDFDNMVWQHQILFKDKASAETYLELVGDMKRLSDKFEIGKNNYLLFYDAFNEVVEYTQILICQNREYYFSKENVEFIFNKYPQEVLKTFIEYCK